MFSSAEARFRKIAPKSGRENAADLRKEAMSQHEQGWLRPPVPLYETGRPADLPSNGFNTALRFGVVSADKLRACVDLKHSLTYTACRVHNPIKLVSWDHVSQLCRIFAADGRDWALFKADREAAYKQHPPGPDGRLYAITALRNPETGRRHGFRSMTLMFGSIAAVIRYNVFSRVVAAIFNRLFGTPLICFFGDFAALFTGFWKRRGWLSSRDFAHF